MSAPTLPTVAEIKARIISDCETAIGQTVPILPKAFIRLLAGGLAGVFLLLYEAVLWVYAQIFPERADREALILLGKLVGLTPTPAVAWFGTADVGGTNGESVLEGEQFTSAAGFVYKVTTGGVISDGVCPCVLECVTKGEAGNLVDGETLSIVSAKSYLTGSATVTDTTTEGEDAETTDDFRARVVIRYKRRFTGGSPADYELWGLEAPHFVWVSPYADEDVPGKIIVYGKVDNEPDGIPTSGQLDTLLEYLTYNPDTAKKDRAPIGDTIECLPISRYGFDIEIQIKNGTEILKANIETAIKEYLEETLQPYNEGVSAVTNNAVTNSGISSVAFDLAAEAGATILQVVLYETATGTIINNYVLYGGEFAKLNSISFEDVV